MRKSKEILGEPDDFATLNRRTGVFGAIFFIPLIVWDLPLWINKTDYVTEFYYEGQGKVIYTREERVRQVLWDPTEDGYY